MSDGQSLSRTGAVSRAKSVLDWLIVHALFTPSFTSCEKDSQPVATRPHRATRRTAPGPCPRAGSTLFTMHTTERKGPK